MSNLPKAICKGQQGDSLVDVTINGRTEKLPSAHKYFMHGLNYNRPDVGWLSIPGKGPRWLDAITRSTRVVLTDDEITLRSGRPIRAKRTGYIAIYAIDDLKIDSDGIHFRFVERIADARE